MSNCWSSVLLGQITGTEIKSLQGFCEGRISDFDFIRCRNPELTLTSVIEHYGDFGGTGTQTPDIYILRFTTCSCNF